MLSFSELTNSNQGANSKGFTLIELLAVIVILAVVALVATPIIIISVSKAKESAASSSALGYIDGINKSIELQTIESVGLGNGFYTLDDLESLKSQGKLSDDIKIQGNTPTAGWVLVQGNSVTQYSLIIDGYRVSEIRNIDETTTTKTVVKADDNTELLAQPNFYISNPDAVYLDPTDLSKTCTESDVNDNLNNNGTPTEIKDGCMKWYVYYNDGYDAKLLLDHNTTARLSFSNKSLTGIDSTTLMTEEIKLKLLDDSKNWDKAKIKQVSTITLEEVEKITGKTNNGNGFYFDGTEFAWLYNNTKNCTSYGCTVEDSYYYNYQIKDDNDGFVSGTSKYTFRGYWTNTPKGTTNHVWLINCTGKIASDKSDLSDAGIRPVIKVPTSLVQ